MRPSAFQWEHSQNGKDNTDPWCWISLLCPHGLQHQMAKTADNTFLWDLQMTVYRRVLWMNLIEYVIKSASICTVKMLRFNFKVILGFASWIVPMFPYINNSTTLTHFTVNNSFPWNFALTSSTIELNKPLQSVQRVKPYRRVNLDTILQFCV